MASEQSPQVEPAESDNAGTIITSAVDPAPPGPEDAANSSDRFAPGPTIDEPDDEKEKTLDNSAPPTDDVKEIAPPTQESHLTDQFVIDKNPAVENDPRVPSGRVPDNNAAVPESQVVADIDAASQVADALALANQSSAPPEAVAQEQPPTVNELTNAAIGAVEKPPQASPSSPSSRIPKKTVQGSPQLSSKPPAYSPGGSIPPPPPPPPPQQQQHQSHYAPNWEQSPLILPEGIVLPSSITPQQMDARLRRSFLELSPQQMRDVLAEYDEAVREKVGEIRNHAAYLFGVVKRYKQMRNHPSGEGGQLSPAVAARLDQLVNSGYCTADEVDVKLRSKMILLSQEDALNAIDEMNGCTRGEIRNFGSYFMGILNRYQKGIGRNQHRRRPDMKSSNYGGSADRFSHYGRNGGANDTSHYGRGDRRGGRDRRSRRRRSRSSSYDSRSRSRSDSRDRYSRRRSRSRSDSRDRYRSSSRRHDDRMSSRDPRRHTSASTTTNPPGGMPTKTYGQPISAVPPPPPRTHNNMMPQQQPMGMGQQMMPGQMIPGTQPQMQAQVMQAMSQVHQQPGQMGGVNPAFFQQQMLQQQQNMPQPGMPQLGMSHPGMAQPSMPQSGMSQPGMAQPGMAQPGMQHMQQFQRPPPSAMPHDPRRQLQGMNPQNQSQGAKLSMTGAQVSNLTNMMLGGGAPVAQQSTSRWNMPQQQPQPGGGVDILGLADKAAQALSGVPPGANPNFPPPPSHSFGHRTVVTEADLPMMVRYALANLRTTGHVDQNLDGSVCGMLKRLPEPVALSSLETFSSCDLSKMRSKTAYLSGILKKELIKLGV